MKKFLIPLAPAIAALVSQQSLASDTSNPNGASVSSATALTINPNGAIVPLKARIFDDTSNLMLVKAKGNVIMASHRSHRSHSSHRSHRSHRSGR